MTHCRLRGPRLFVLFAITGVACSTTRAESKEAEGPPVEDARQALGVASYESAVARTARDYFNEGQRVFRFDTFGDEAFWGGHAPAARGDRGRSARRRRPGRQPEHGARARPQGRRRRAAARARARSCSAARSTSTIRRPRSRCCRLNAVVGVTGFFDGDGALAVGRHPVRALPLDGRRLARAGHRPPARRLGRTATSTSARSSRWRRTCQPLADLLGVDEDDRARRCSTAGARASSTPSCSSTARRSARTARSAATLIPPAFGLAGVNLHTWTGWGSVTHWNAFVANLEMHGKGTFFDPRLDDAGEVPDRRARTGFGNVRNTPGPDHAASSPALHFYQLALPAPDAAGGQLRRRGRRARRGSSSTGKAQCATCHVPPLFTEPGWNLHTPAEIGIDDFQANRSPDERYRTTPLEGPVDAPEGRLLPRRPLRDAARRGRPLRRALRARARRAREKSDLVEYLKSL